MIILEWPSGKMDFYSTWRDAERGLRDEQWTRYRTKVAFRISLGARAWVWSRTKVNVVGSSEVFMKALAAAGMFKYREMQ